MINAWPRRSRLLTAAFLVFLLLRPALARVSAVAPVSQDRIYSNRVDLNFKTERFAYEFRWNGLLAAEAEWVGKRQRVGGKSLIEGKGKAKTVKPVAILWKMRGTIHAVAKTEPLVPENYVLSRNESSRRTEMRLRFDHEAGVLRIDRIGKHGSPRKYTQEITGQYDPVSAAVALRALNLGDGETLRIDVQPGKNPYRIEFQCLGKEEVVVKAGAFKAMVLSASIYDLIENTPWEGLKNSRLWISDDPRRLFLKAESYTSVGRVSAELVTYQWIAQEPP